MQLKPGTLLQGEKYRIVRALGQGGFGITYEAEQVLLRRKVAVKEFFMKDCCERDDATSRVTVGTGNQRALVERFRGKFIREAQMIAGMDHPHIVRVLDVFEENGTAYYVMDFLPGGSLADKVKKDGPLSEAMAEEYIRQVADALDYIHGQNTVHLDVKPSNILLNAKGEAVLIDFGISKHYDDSGEQTSSTPVGISRGYAPLEQGRDGDVSQFGPPTDIYALGATLYYLVTGIAPPEASIVNDGGFTKPKGVSDRTWNIIVRSMQPRRKDRPQDIPATVALLDGFSESLDDKTVVGKHPSSSQEDDHTAKAASFPHPKSHKAWIWASLSCLVLVAIAMGIFFGWKENGKERLSGFPESIAETSKNSENTEIIHEDIEFISEQDLARNKVNLAKVYSILKEEQFTHLGKNLEEFSSMMSLVTNRKLAYERLCEDYEMGTFEEFDERFYPATEEHMEKEKNRRWLYRMLKDEGVPVGDYNTFCLLLCYEDDLMNYYKQGLKADLELGPYEEFCKYMR